MQVPKRIGQHGRYAADSAPDKKRGMLAQIGSQPLRLLLAKQGPVKVVSALTVGLLNRSAIQIRPSRVTKALPRFNALRGFVGVLAAQIPLNSILEKDPSDFRPHTRQKPVSLRVRSVRTNC